MNLKELINKNMTIKFSTKYSDNLKILKLPKIPSIILTNKEYQTFSINFSKEVVCNKIYIVENSNNLATLILNYNYFKYSHIIKVLCNINISSYEVIGKVVHFNLKQEFLKFKFIIGKIVYDKTKYIVINKINEIDNLYRNYNFEVIGGKEVDKILEGQNFEKELYNVVYNERFYDFYDNLTSKKNLYTNDDEEINHNIISKDVLELKSSDFNKDILKGFINTYYVDATINIKTLSTIHEENECKFNIDLKNVYWCSKLQEERKFLINILPKNKIIVDVFCGVGPLVIPLLKKGCEVYCNDLNTDAIKCLKTNCKLNKVNCDNIFNMDAKDFLIQVRGDCYVFNLPEYSLDYVKYVREGLIYCYFFCRNDPVEEVTKRTGIDGGEIKFVRKVSPCKSVYRWIYKK